MCSYINPASVDNLLLMLSEVQAGQPFEHHSTCVVHLFTSYDFAEGVVGLAYTGNKNAASIQCTHVVQLEWVVQLKWGRDCFDHCASSTAPTSTTLGRRPPTASFFSGPNGFVSLSRAIHRVCKRSG